jgi:hypothetical protein
VDELGVVGRHGVEGFEEEEWCFDDFTGNLKFLFETWNFFWLDEERRDF